MEEMVTITKESFDDLLDSDKMLLALQSAGVDNWSGYEYAMELYRLETK